MRPAMSSPLSSRHGSSALLLISLVVLTSAAPYDELTRLRRSAAPAAVLSPLGKRITSSLVAELGKRPKDMYSFGIGAYDTVPNGFYLCSHGTGNVRARVSLAWKKVFCRNWSARLSASPWNLGF